MVVVCAARKKFKRMLILPVIMIAVSVGSGILGNAVQSLIVSPDEFNKESEYLENNMKYTQMAYGIDKVKDTEFSAKGTLTSQNIVDNQPTISNIRINDFTPSKQFYNQTQSIRTYYTFNDVDVDRYMIDGEYHADIPVSERNEQLKSRRGCFVAVKAYKVYSRLRYNAFEGRCDNCYRSAGDAR